MPSATDPAPPIDPSRFAAAIAELELDQLHTEAARLKNSLYHLERSNVQLEEFKDDPDCIDALRENARTAQNQQERVRMLEEEIEKRGFGRACGSAEAGGDGETAANGNGATPGVAETSNRHTEGAEEHEAEGGEEEGVYL